MDRPEVSRPRGASGDEPGPVHPGETRRLRPSLRDPTRLDDPGTPAVLADPSAVHGNLTDEPALRYSPSGVAVLKCTVAVNGRRFDRRTDRWVDKTPVFHQVVAFNALAQNAANTLAKGMTVTVTVTVTVTGELADDSWQTKDGRKVWRTQLEAADIAVSLPRYATAQVTKTRREQPADPAAEPVG